jgi:mannose-6-phosphate isomerase
MQAKLGPVVLRPIVQERIWGVERLPEWYEQPPAGKTVGEVWLTAETCVAVGGAMSGSSLAEITERWPLEMGGGSTHVSEARRGAPGFVEGFPLLIKVLLPKEKLSVQVHPNDVEAAAMGLPRGKTECWYVLEAEVGAEVAVGFREAIAPKEIVAAIADGTLEDKLRYLPVKAGDMVFVDAGTVHAIGPGMVVLETQQYSDVTYRLYDYGRPRELHVEAGLAVSKTETAAGLVTPVTMEGFTRLVVSEYFAVDRFVVSDEVSLGYGSELQILVALTEGLSVADVALPAGFAVVLPAEGVEYVVRGSGELVRVLQG